jgi:hypothetical protein
LQQPPAAEAEVRPPRGKIIDLALLEVSGPLVRSGSARDPHRQHRISTIAAMFVRNAG